MSLAPPTSPIMGWISTPGEAVHTSPVVQLLNPSGSGVRLVVYELLASIFETTGAGANRQLRQRRTRTPLTPLDTIVTGIPRRMNQEDAALPIKGIIRGSKDNAAHTILTDAQCQLSWIANTEPPKEAPLLVRRPGRFPITIVPGSAWEAQAVIGTFATEFLRLVAVWDELAYP